MKTLHNKKYNFLVFVAINCLLLMWIIAYIPMTIDSFRIGYLAYSLVDALLILSPVFFVSVRYRWTYQIPMWLITLYAFCNICYFHFFEDLMPLYSFFLWRNVDGVVVGSVVDILTIKTVYVWLLPLASTLLYVMGRKKMNVPAPAWSKSYLFAGILLLHVSVYTTRMWNGYNQWGKQYAQVRSEANYSFLKYVQECYTQYAASRWYKYTKIGFVTHVARECRYLYLTLFQSRGLNDEEKQELDDFLKNHPCGESRDFAFNEQKNVILIVVESLNAWALNLRVGGREVTPNMNRLLDEEGTVSCLTVMPQVCSGNSSDGQFMLNTGLLPNRETETIMLYPDNDYISLAKILKKKISFEVICEKPSLWNHDKTTISYGYDRLFSNAELLQVKAQNKKLRGEDAAMFHESAQIMDTIGKPFYAQLTTLSMHSPFKDEEVVPQAWINESANSSESYRNYIQMVHYFDGELGLFIDTLKQKGMYENSLIFITSDHGVAIDGVSGGRNNPIVFIALNTGISKKIERTVGQIDLFPTMLELSGKLTGASWKGVGMSILNDELKSAVGPKGEVCGLANSYTKYQQNAWVASEYILRSDYFKK